MPIPFEDEDFYDDDIDYLDDDEEHDNLGYEAIIDWDSLDNLDIDFLDGQDSDDEYNFDNEN